MGVWSLRMRIYVRTLVRLVGVVLVLIGAANIFLPYLIGFQRVPVPIISLVYNSHSVIAFGDVLLIGVGGALTWFV
jgi:hypothetical protein